MSKERKNAARRNEAARSKARAVRAKYAADPLGRAKVLARAAVFRAIRSGRMVRPDVCGICRKDPGTGADGRTLLRADHYRGYAREHWLDVRWVCVGCDGELEKKRAAADKAF